MNLLRADIGVSPCLWRAASGAASLCQIDSHPKLRSARGRTNTERLWAIRMAGTGMEVAHIRQRARRQRALVSRRQVRSRPSLSHHRDPVSQLPHDGVVLDIAVDRDAVRSL